MAVSGLWGPSDRMRTSPSVHGISPASTLRRVDFPQPLGPTTQQNSPACTDRETSSSAVSVPLEEV